MKKIALTILLANIYIFAQDDATTEAVEQPIQPPPLFIAEPPIKENIVPTQAKNAWYKGIEAGLGMGVPGGFSFNAGYRFPRSESFWKNRLGFRLSYNTLNPIWGMVENTANKEGQKVIDDDIDINGMVIVSGSKFKADLSSGHFGVLVNIHPFGYMFALGGLRLTAGYYFGGLDLSAKISDYTMSFDQTFKSEAKIMDSNGEVIDNIDPVEVDVSIEGDLEEKDVGSLKTKMAFNSNGPYVGFGWDVGIVGGLHLTFDAGVVSSGAHKISLDIPKLKLPEDAKVTVSWEDPASYNPKEQQQLNDFLKQLEEQGYCGDASGIPSCDEVKNDQKIKIPEHLVQQYKDDYSYVIDDFNANVEKEKEKALNGKKSKDGKDGVNTLLKKYSYFPIFKIGFMWRF